MKIRSPFPGMDPWLELFWEDVHQRAMTYAADYLAPQLPPGLHARLGERVFVDSDMGQPPQIAPDVRISEGPSRPRRGRSSKKPGGTAVAEPILIPIGDDPVVEGYVEIIDTRSGGKLITSIELISKTNKRPGSIGMRKYRQKQEEVVAAGANLVEIDLLREGERILLCPQESIPPRYRTPYQVCVFRAEDPSVCEYYPIPLQQRLPAISIPLRADDEDVVLNLQTLINDVYSKAPYDFLDYQNDPSPPLKGEDAAWADTILNAAGRR